MAATSPEQRKIFEEQVLDPVIREYRYKQQSLCGFMALKGSEYAGSRKLMVVGRAVNGWGEGAAASDLATSDSKEKLIEGIFYHDGVCQLAWVVEGAGNQEGYNTNRSAFWRVIKEVSRSLGVWEEEDEGSWSSRLVWSNLYKLSPHSGGNPSDALCALQEPGCIELLREEIIEYNPARVLFLTGMGWAWPFMKGLGCRLQAVQGLVDARGVVELPDERPPVPIVIAAHPQAKGETAWVDQVLAAFAAHDEES